MLTVKKSKKGVRIQDKSHNLEVLIEFAYGYKDYYVVSKKSVLRGTTKFPVDFAFRSEDMFTLQRILKTTCVSAWVGAIGSSDDSKYYLGRGNAICSSEDTPSKACGRFVAVQNLFKNLQPDEKSAYTATQDDVNIVGYLIESGLNTSGIKFKKPKLSVDEENLLLKQIEHVLKSVPTNLAKRAIGKFSSNI